MGNVDWKSVMGCIKDGGEISRFTNAQLDRMVWLHDHGGMTYRAIGVRYGMSEKQAQRVVHRHLERKNES